MNRYPYLYRQTTRHGKLVWYYRRERHGPRVRIKAEYGTEEFDKAYREILAKEPARARTTAPTSSLQWLIARYMETTAWSALSGSTRRQRGYFYKQVVETAGEVPYAKVTEAAIVAGKQRRTAVQARNFLDAMRGLFRWAKESGFIANDPTLGVKNPPRKNGVGFQPWTEDHVEAYYARWPLGTRQRVWLDVLLHTGLRRGDAVMLGRQHVRAGFIKAEKNGIEVPVFLLGTLKATLAAGPTGDLAFIVGESGRPLTKESFGNLFRVACKAAGVPGSAHGLRKLAATRMANAGATEAQLMAVFGWTDPKMATLYTRTANRQRLAQESMTKLNETGTKCPSPFSAAPLTLQKAKG